MNYEKRFFSSFIIFLLEHFVLALDQVQKILFIGFIFSCWILTPFES